MNDRYIVPKCLALAAKAATDPKWIGQIVIALVGGKESGLDQGQRTILTMCREEIADIDRKRLEARDRKRRSRAKGGV